MARELTVGVAIEAKDGFSREAAKIAASSDKLAGRLRSGQRRLAELGERAGSLKRLDEAGRRLSRTALAMDAAKRRTRALRGEMKATEAPSKKLTAAFRAARRESSRLHREHMRQKAGLRSLREELREAGIDTGNLAEEQRRAARRAAEYREQVRGVNAAAQKWDDANAALGRRTERAAQVSLIAGGVAQAGGRLREAGFAPASLARPLAESQGLLRQLGMTPEGVGTVTRAGREAAGTLPGMSVPQFVDLAYPIKSGISSLDPEGVAALAGIAAVTARATAAEPLQIADTLARAQATFKAPLHPDMGEREFAGRFGAVLTKAAQDFRTTGSQMAAAIENAGAGMSLSGVSLPEQMALLGILQGSMDGSEVGTVTRQLQTAAVDAEKEFAKQGRRVRLIGEDRRMLDPSEMLANLTAAFGGEWTDVAGAEIKKALKTEEAMRFFQLLWNDADRLRAHVTDFESAWDAGEAYVRTVQAARDDNPHARLQVVEQRIAATMERVGEEQLAAIQGTLGIVERLLGRVEGMFGSPAVSTVMIAGGAVGTAAEVGANIAMAAYGMQTLRAWLSKRRERGRTKRALQGSPTPRGPLPGMKQGREPGRTKRALQPPPTPRRPLPGMKQWPRALSGAGWRGALTLGKDAIGKAGRLLKGRGGIGLALSALSLANTLNDEQKSGREKLESAGGNLGAIGGGFAGMKYGALIGTTVAGPPGTLAGALIGSLAGSLIGDRVGEAAARGAAAVLAREPDPGSEEAAGGLAPAPPTGERSPVAPPPERREGGRVQETVHHHHHNAPVAQISVYQQPGEDPANLVNRMLDALYERNEEIRRGLYADG